ncbi:MAG: hypothetical protein IIT39_01750 [Clostridia bacterium]|nr:hypothetical protein [Clostridia bacterium]
MLKCGKILCIVFAGILLCSCSNGEDIKVSPEIAIAEKTNFTVEKIDVDIPIKNGKEYEVKVTSECKEPFLVKFKTLITEMNSIDHYPYRYVVMDNGETVIKSVRETLYKPVGYICGECISESAVKLFDYAVSDKCDDNSNLFFFKVETDIEKDGYLEYDIVDSDEKSVLSKKGVLEINSGRGDRWINVFVSDENTELKFIPKYFFGFDYFQEYNSGFNWNYYGTAWSYF